MKNCVIVYYGLLRKPLCNEIVFAMRFLCQKSWEMFEIGILVIA
jgi:hypothetical protein